MEKPSPRSATHGHVSPSHAEPRVAYADVARCLVGDESPIGFAPGTTLLDQGESVRSIYLIDEGTIKLCHTNEDGQALILGLRSRGWILGASAIILQLPQPTSATALTRCLLHRLSADRFRRLLQRRASVSWYVHQLHARDIDEQMLRTASLGSLSARRRLERFLAEFLPPVTSPPPPRGYRLDIPLHHWEVAQLIAVTPTYLSELLRDLEADGVLRRWKGFLYVLTPARLGCEQGSGFRTPSFR